MRLQLVWTPTDDPRDFAAFVQAAFNGQTVSIAIDDVRANAERIGENHEDREPKPVMTADNVAKYVGQNLANILQSNGIQIVPSGATRNIKLELAQFFVTEDNSYQGTVVFHGTIVDENGHPIWQGEAKGTSERHGRSFSEENYEQTFSDATLDAIRQIMRSVAGGLAPVAQTATAYAAAALPSAAPAPGGQISPDAFQIPLQWHPTDDPHDIPAFQINAFSGQSLQVAANDERPSPTLIGENREHGARSVVTTDSVAAYVAQNLANVLQMDGVRIVPAGGSRILSLAVAEFFVEEENTYQGSVTLRATLTNPAGKTLWQGSVRGTSHRFGRSLNVENYQETIADSTLDALRALMRNLEFQAAVKSAD
jgi:uncharacterized lipoprotein YajG